MTMNQRVVDPGDWSNISILIFKNVSNSGSVMQTLPVGCHITL